MSKKLPFYKTFESACKVNGNEKANQKKKRTDMAPNTKRNTNINVKPKHKTENTFRDFQKLSICTMKTDLLNVSQFYIPLSSTLDLTFYEQLGVCFQKSERTLNLLVHLVHAPKFQWSPSCSFTFVTLYVLFWLFHVLCCVRLFSMSGLVPGFHSFDLTYQF